MLQRLLAAGPETGSARVICLGHLGEVGRRLRAQGISVEALNGASRSSPRPIVTLARLLRAQRPDVVQTWMYHADLIGGLAARLAGVPVVVWNLRTGHVPGPELALPVRWAPWALARLSHRLPDAVVCGSGAALVAHVAAGYAPAKMVVIPNGFDVPAIDPDTHDAVRDELGIPTDALVIGLVGRWHVQKDHRTFVEAARLFTQAGHEAWFVLVGPGVVNPQLSGWIQEAGLADRFVVLDHRPDIGRLTSAFDIACSSSWAEGLSNTLGEAMACGIPVVATDVGDAAVLVGKGGLVVAPRDPRAMAEALGSLAMAGPSERARIGAIGRTRIIERYSVDTMASSYHDLYQELFDRVRDRRLSR